NGIHPEYVECTVRCAGDGDLKILLRGPYRKEDDKPVPLWLRFTSFSVNGEPVIDGEHARLVWHGRPFEHAMPVKDGDEVRLAMEWQPSDPPRKSLFPFFR
ncbi:MAG: hypothetical protein MJ061_05045, partial [Mailhella sp.]|nr:hypothetical protein [Mailhella sp.]